MAHVAALSRGGQPTRSPNESYSNRRSGGVVDCGEVGRRLRRAGCDRSALGMGA
jgi:hypothetical protein